MDIEGGALVGAFIIVEQTRSPSDALRHASTWSILCSVLLIIFGMLAVGTPALAAVAVNAVIGWLIVLAGAVHLVLAFYAHRAGSLLWKMFVGIAYVFFGVYLIAHPALGVGLLTLVLGSLFLVEGHFGHRPVFPGEAHSRIKLDFDGWDRNAAVGTDDLPSLAIQLQLGYRHHRGRQYDHQRCDPTDVDVGSAQRHCCGGIVTAIQSSLIGGVFRPVRSGRRNTWEV